MGGKGKNRKPTNNNTTGTMLSTRTNCNTSLKQCMHEQQRRPLTAKSGTHTERTPTSFPGSLFFPSREARERDRQSSSGREEERPWERG